MAARAPELLDARLLMFTGKGGVGKTTSVVACALAAAAAGRRPLVVEMGHRASLDAIFDADAAHDRAGQAPSGPSGPSRSSRSSRSAIGYAPRAVGRGVHAMNLEFEAALVEYLEQHIKMKRVVRGITRNNALMRFFQAAPSVGEVATLNKLAMLVDAREGGRPRWDPVIVDLDATGHALMLLNLPRVMDGLIGDGPMRGLIDGFSSLLSDPRRSCLNLVTLPRELPAQETLELFESLERDHDVPLGRLIVNKVPSLAFDAKTEALAAEVRAHLKAHPELTAAARAMVVADRAQSRHARAVAELARLRAGINLPLVELPMRATTDLDTLTRFGEQIMAPTGSGEASVGGSP